MSFFVFRIGIFWFFFKFYKIFFIESKICEYGYKNEEVKEDFILFLVLNFYRREYIKGGWKWGVI